MLTVVVFIITLLILVLSHEFGHFSAAKRFGIKVLEFGFGLPPKIFGKKIGETIYSLNWLPIGGFVRLFGEDEVDKEVLDDPRSFASKPVWQRIVVVIAGVLMNLLLATALFYIVLGSKNFTEEIVLLTPHNFAGVEQRNEQVVFIGEVAQGSPAEAAGIKPQDRVVKVNNQSITGVEDFVNLINQNAGEQTEVTLLNPENQERQVTVVHRANPPEGQGALGVRLGGLTIAHIAYQTSGQKIASGFVHSYNLTVYSAKVLGSLISVALEEKSTEPLADTVAGPVGITTLAGSILQLGLIPYLNFMALLSLNLAIINILPFPARRQEAADWL